ncbi:MAG: prephenate dehydratase [Gemmatimonadaceae bacterium]|nr:prephenate dehydratase [Gemmatimonadaceae bacterium]
MPRVAFQGDLGAFSEEAIVALWGAAAEPVPMRELRDVAHAVAVGEAELGLLPVENTLAGSVVGSYDALAEHDALSVVAEVTIPIHHCVLGVRGATLETIERVESHPVALAQCERFFRAHPRIVAQAAYDTAGAAREVAERGDRRVAAIAGRRAATRFALDVLAADIEDRPDNQTRFVAIARAPAPPPAGTPARTTLILTTANVPGALHRVLQPLAEHGINLSKLESRPTGEPWSYRFFVDLEHAAGDPRLDAAISAIRAATQSLRIVGTYRRAAGASAPGAAAPEVARGGAMRAAGEGSAPADRTPGVVVIGLGVIGGSLARALTVQGVATRAFATSDEDRALAARAGVVVAGSLGDALQGVGADDIVVVAVPPGALGAVLREVRTHVARDVVVFHATGLQTDRALGLDPAHHAATLGAHPLAGSHGSGFGASRLDLFRGCTVSVEARADARARRLAEWLWHTAGAACVEYRSAAEHDRRIAWASHLPQLAATGIASALARAGLDPAALGPGGRDVTRLAASPFALWRDLLERAPADTLAAVDAVAGSLASLHALLAARDLGALERVWTEAAAWRRAADPPANTPPVEDAARNR